MRVKIEKYFERELREIDAKIPDDFVVFWSTYYGQPVNIELTDIHGAKWKVDRFLHLDDHEDSNDKIHLWRNDGVEHLAYSVEFLESSMPNWEDRADIFPFAGINCKGTSEYNLVVLDYTCSQRPKVSIWVHEKSFGREDAFLIAVSPDVKHFMDCCNTLMLKSE